jgi:hypothetical protein
VRRIWIAAALAAVTCSPAVAHREDAPAVAPAPAQASARAGVIDHLTPRRDLIGPSPTRFTWTAVDGADSYSIGVWNESDVLVWREDDLTSPAATRSDGARFEPGTYFWSVSALRNGEEIAQSGLAAFVVRE